MITMILYIFITNIISTYSIELLVKIPKVPDYKFCMIALAAYCDTTIEVKDCAQSAILNWDIKDIISVPLIYQYHKNFKGESIKGNILSPDEYCLNREPICHSDLEIFKSLGEDTGSAVDFALSFTKARLLKKSKIFKLFYKTFKKADVHEENNYALLYLQYIAEYIVVAGVETPEDYCKRKFPTTKNV